MTSHHTVLSEAPLAYDKYRRPLTEVYFPWRRLQVLSLDSGGLGTPAIDSSDDP